MIDRPPARDLTRLTLGIIAILAMLAASAWVLLPFLAALVWAATIAIACWPILVGLQRRFGGRRGPAVAVLTLALVALLVTPIWVGLSTLGANAGRIADAARSVARDGLPPPPAWVERLPVVGPRLDARWQELAGDPELLGGRLSPHVAEAARWVAARAGGLGAALVQLALTVAISAILFASGEGAALGVRRFLRRLAGQRGDDAAVLAAKAVRAVALGIVVTAIAQTTLAGLGLAFAGVPHAGALTAAAFVLCIAQLGPLLILGPAVIWLYSGGATGRATLLLAFAVVAGALDNVLRPVLIRKGADLPLLLIMAGVIGGLLGFGIVGLFIGPVILAVTWTLLASWVGELDRERPPQAP